MSKITVLNGGQEQTVEDVLTMATQCEQTARLASAHGNRRQARMAKKTAREWREIAARMLVQNRQTGENQ